MDYIKPIITAFKPLVPIVIVIAVLKITGQFENAISFSQAAILKTGIFNAGTDLNEEEEFDFNFEAISIASRKSIQLDSLKGKVIFLNIWATWCGPCRAEMPTIQSLYNSMDNENIAFVMLAIDHVDPLNRVTNYVTRNEFTFPVYLLKGEPTTQIRVPTIPTTFIISKTGKILRQESGMRNYDTKKFKKFLEAEAAK